TEAPASAKRRAMHAPMPWLAPVTIATRPDKLNNAAVLGTCTMGSPDEDETVNDDWRTASGTPLVASVEDIIGDYRSFLAGVRKRLKGGGIDITGRAVSHLAFRTATVSEYEAVQQEHRGLVVGDEEEVR